jgi:D-alanyl-lipoteichoic acid acyltransferase DltB (MBOAT superfamily)
VIFNSVTFVVFFAVVYGMYRALGDRYKIQNRLLLLASYVFYGYWDWRFLSLIIASTAVDFYCGNAIADRPLRKYGYLTLSVVANLTLLFTFKYFRFFHDSFVELLNSFSIPADPLTLQIVLPVGISFYTFQTMSYTIDIARGEIEPCRDVLDFALFVAFFPQLVAGPIERAASLLPQLTNRRTVTSLQVREGLWLVAWGYCKKVFIADNVANLVDAAFNTPGTGTGATALIGVYAFAIQIYCDFSGYSDIARGLAKLMGIELRLNFNLPYFARTPSDFWSRWHISLSTWLRDYLYIPMGGNRRGTGRTYRNLFVTMLLGGLWHGAAWTFVAWGVFHGCLLVVYRALPVVSIGSRILKRAVSGAAAVLMFHLTCIGWLLFRAESVSQAWTMLQAIVTNFRFSEAAGESLTTLAGYSVILMAVQVLQETQNDHNFVIHLPVPIRGTVYGLLLYLTLIHGAVSDAFIYFQF